MTVSVTSSIANPYRHTINTGAHTFYSDVPTPGVPATAPTPHELLLGALGACTSMTIQAYAALKKLPITDVKVELDDATSTKPGKTPGSTVKVPRIEKKIEIKGNISAADKAKVEQRADNCHVHKILTGDKDVASAFDWTV